MDVNDKVNQRQCAGGSYLSTEFSICFRFHFVEYPHVENSFIIQSIDIFTFSVFLN